MIGSCKLPGRWRARPGRALVRDEGGVVAIEFSIIIPLFLLIVYCFMELGRMLFIHNSLGHAVFEAGRFAIVSGSASESPAGSDDITDHVVAAAQSLDEGLLDVVVAFAPDNKPGSVVSITATYQFSFMTGLIPVEGFDLESATSVVIAR